MICTNIQTNTTFQQGAGWHKSNKCYTFLLPLSFLQIVQSTLQLTGRIKLTEFTRNVDAATSLRLAERSIDPSAVLPRTPSHLEPGEDNVEEGRVDPFDEEDAALAQVLQKLRTKEWQGRWKQTSWGLVWDVLGDEVAFLFSI